MRTMRSAVCLPVALVAFGSCAGASGTWREVDPQRPMITLTGRLETLDMPAEGNVRFEVTPDPEHRYALAPGQQRIVCIVPARDRGDLTSSLLNLEVGQHVDVSGYWTARDEAAGVRHFLADTTCVFTID